jgi:hypothetical protein
MVVFNWQLSKLMISMNQSTIQTSRTEKIDFFQRKQLLNTKPLFFRQFYEYCFYSY